MKVKNVCAGRMLRQNRSQRSPWNLQRRSPELLSRRCTKSCLERQHAGNCGLLATCNCKESDKSSVYAAVISNSICRRGAGRRHLEEFRQRNEQLREQSPQHQRREKTVHGIIGMHTMSVVTRTFQVPCKTRWAASGLSMFAKLR